MLITCAQQKGGVGKTTTAANIGVLLARNGRRLLLVDTDPQNALTRQLGLQAHTLGVNLVDVLAGRAAAEDAVISGVHGVDVIAGARDLAGVEMSLVGEMGREQFLRDALEPVLPRYDHLVIDTPPNLGLLTVNALVAADHVIAPVSGEDEASVHGLLELQITIARLVERLRIPPPALTVVLTRWQPQRLSSQQIEDALINFGIAPAARVRARSALFALAAARCVPLALSAPDSSIALAYASLLERLPGVIAR
jgi:chromosome partitioning protein